jgi:hypothetical protein
MVKIRIKKSVESLKDLINNLNNQDRVTYVRFGDNDVFHMYGKDAKQRVIKKPLGNNKTIYSKQLQLDLKISFDIEHPHFMKAVGCRWPIEAGMMKNGFSGNKIPRVVNHYVGRLTKTREFYHPILFSYLACLRPSIWNYFNCRHIKSRDKVFVGCNNPDQLKQLGSFREWVSTPAKNATSETDIIFDNLCKCVKPHDMVILGCGQLSRVLAGKLWQTNIPLHVLDIGSHIDGYAGKTTRKYLRKYSECLQQSV